ncbi:MAG: hypothetical protein GVY05_12175 [Bacteroidetes bacterium]|nr:hypothetical protein [Bacteroidota bacterium]
MQIFFDIQTWHPLTVHFPIAFLSLSTLLSFYLVFKYKKTLAQFNLSILFLGVICAIVSLYTGDIEDGKVSRTLCDPTILKDHENYAYYTVYAFLGCTVLWSIKLFTSVIKIKKAFMALILILNFAGLAGLIYVGHLGASLVYEQAAGINIPSEDCLNF